MREVNIKVFKFFRFEKNRSKGNITKDITKKEGKKSRMRK